LLWSHLHLQYNIEVEVYLLIFFKIQFFLN